MGNDFNENSVAKMAAGQMAGLDVAVMHNPTIGENIDARIRRAEAQVASLKEVKQKMTASGLLEVRIHDLREAMNF